MEYEDENGKQVEAVIIPAQYGMFALWKQLLQTDTSEEVYRFDIKRVIAYRVETIHTSKETQIGCRPLCVAATNLEQGLSEVSGTVCMFVGTWKECQYILLTQTSPAAAAKLKEFENMKITAKEQRQQARLSKIAKKTKKKGKMVASNTDDEEEAPEDKYLN